MAAGSEPQVVLYGRQGCCLCDDARELLLRVRDRHEFGFEERDIERDDALLAAYLERIPVVTIDGEEAFELFVDEAELELALSRDRRYWAESRRRGPSQMPSAEHHKGGSL